VKSDLTRWNRAGLKRFRYVDGNAATYLEALRRELFDRLTGWDRELLGIDPENRKEEFAEYLDLFGEDHLHALNSYLSLNDKRGSVALEIVRSFARGAHVLTEHLDAYANEGYLGTATQWENVRRLVHGLDYHPTPPDSAVTHLILNAKPEKSGLVARGLQVKHTPEGRSPVVFETLKDIEIDPALNVLRLKGWDRVQETVTGDTLTLDGIVEGLKKGDPVIIENENGMLPCLLKENPDIGNESTELKLDLPADTVLGSRSDVIVHLKPLETLEVFGPVIEQTLKPGNSSLYLKEEPVSSSGEAIIKEGDYVYVFRKNIQTGNIQTGYYGCVSYVDVKGKRINLEADSNLLESWKLSEATDYVGELKVLEKVTGKTIPTSPQDLNTKEEIEKNLRKISGSEFILTTASSGSEEITFWGDKSELKNADILVCAAEVFYRIKISEVKVANMEVDKISYPNVRYSSLTLSFNEKDPAEATEKKIDLTMAEIDQIWLPPSESQWKWEIDSFIDMANESLKLEVETVNRIGSTDLCVVKCGSNLISARVRSVNATTGKEGRSDLHVYGWCSLEENKNFIRSQTTVSGKFKEQLRLKESDVNEGKISGSGGSGGNSDSEGGNNIGPEGADSIGSLTLEYVEAANLKPDRLIVIEQEPPESKRSHLTKVKSIDNLDGGNGTVITLVDPLPSGYTIGRTVIRANVVQAGHGEAQPEKILGSGNAALSNQEFLFPISDVSFVPDPLQDSGFGADISIVVDGVETWMQVPRFNQSQAADPHYVVRMTEEGDLRILFGDGVNGRRLPTGENNVRIAWRRGSGEAGSRIEAGSFKKPAQPHPRVESIEQPFSSTGGNDKESVTSLRRSAPASLLTMQRAVSTVDFAALAASRPEIWDAYAIQTSSGRERSICVTIVPAWGEELASDPHDELKEYLLARAIPGVRVDLKHFESEPLMLEIVLGINTQRFDVDDVQAEVRKALIERFALKNRTIGAPVYLSDIYQCVEAVRGVEYSNCKLIDSAASSDTGDDSEKPEIQFLKPNRHGVLYIKEKDPDPDESILLTVEKAEETQ